MISSRAYDLPIYFEMVCIATIPNPPLLPFDCRAIMCLWDPYKLGPMFHCWLILPDQTDRFVLQRHIRYEDVPRIPLPISVPISTYHLQPTYKRTVPFSIQLYILIITSWLLTPTTTQNHKFFLQESSENEVDHPFCCKRRPRSRLTSSNCKRNTRSWQRLFFQGFSKPIHNCLSILPSHAFHSHARKRGLTVYC